MGLIKVKGSVTDVPENLASVAAGEGASLVGVNDIAGLYTADPLSVESALAEVKLIVDSLTSDLGTLPSDVAANTSNISTNTGNINANTSNINANANNISLNAIGIAANVAAINANSTAITATENATTNNANAAAANSASIVTLNTDLTNAELAITVLNNDKLSKSSGGTVTGRVKFSEGVTQFGGAPSKTWGLLGGAALELSSTSTIYASLTGVSYSENAYYSSGWKYLEGTDVASQMILAAGLFKVNVASAGAADSAISWTAALEVNNNGDVILNGQNSNQIGINATAITANTNNITANVTTLNSHAVAITDNADNIVALASDSLSKAAGGTVVGPTKFTDLLTQFGGTPAKPWVSAGSAVLELSATSSMLATLSGLSISENAYYNSGWKHTSGTDVASQVNLASGIINFKVATAGAEGTTVNWVTPLTVNNSGNVAVVGSLTLNSVAIETGDINSVANAVAVQNQVVDKTRLSLSGVALSIAAIATGTWVTFSPTGGTGTVWAMLDQVPLDATYIEVLIDIDIRSGGAAAIGMHYVVTSYYVRALGSTTGVGSYSKLISAKAAGYSDGSGQVANSMVTMLRIPLSATNEFQVFRNRIENNVNGVAPTTQYVFSLNVMGWGK